MAPLVAQGRHAQADCSLMVGCSLLSSMPCPTLQAKPLLPWCLVCAHPTCSARHFGSHPLLHVGSIQVLEKGLPPPGCLLGHRPLLCGPGCLSCLLLQPPVLIFNSSHCIVSTQWTLYGQKSHLFLTLAPTMLSGAW